MIDQQTGRSDTRPVTSHGSHSIWKQYAPYGMLALLILELVIFSLLAPTTFPTQATINVVVSNSAVLGLIALALIVPMIAGEIDASLPVALTVTSLTAASLMSHQGWPLAPAVLTAMAFALVIGLTNGLMVVRLKVPSLIATLGMFTILSALITGLASGRVIERGLPKDLLEYMSVPRPLGLPLPLVYLMLVAMVVWYVSEQTPIGRQWRAIGSSPASARMAGIRQDRLRILAFCAGGFLAGIAGTVQLFRTQGGSPNIGPDLLFPGLAAAFLSAAAFRLGVFNVRGVLVSIALIQFGITGLVLIGAPYWTDQIFTGCVLVVALVVARALRPQTT